VQFLHILLVCEQVVSLQYR